MVRIIIDGVDKSNSEITSLTELSDVTITSVADNDLLQFNSGSGEWENVTITSLNDTYVPYVGATTDVTLGANSIFMDLTEKLDIGAGITTYEVGQIETSASSFNIETSNKDFFFDPSSDTIFAEYSLLDSIHTVGPGGPSSHRVGFQANGDFVWAHYSSIPPGGTPDYGIKASTLATGRMTYENNVVGIHDFVASGFTIASLGSTISFFSPTEVHDTSTVAFLVEDNASIEVFKVDTSTPDVIVSSTMSVSGLATLTGGLKTDTINSISAAGITISDNLELADNIKALFGTGLDLEIFHDGTDSQIINNTGTLFIDNDAGDGDINMGGARLLLDETGIGLGFGPDTTLAVSNVGGSTGTPTALGFALIDGGNSPSLLAQFGLTLLNASGGGFDHSATAAGFFGGVFSSGVGLTHTVTNIAGGFFRNQISTSGATYGNVFGITARIGVAGATITNLVIYGGTLENNLGSTITNAYGLLLPNINIATNNFAINTGLGIVSLGDDLQMRNDNDKILLGILQDLELFHDGTDSQIVNNTGDLLIDNSAGSGTVFLITDVDVANDLTINGITNLSGGIITSSATKTADYTILPADDTIYADATSNTVTITLPASPNQDQIFIVFCTNSTFTCTVARNGNNINGAAADRTLVVNQGETYKFDSALGWSII